MCVCASRVFVVVIIVAAVTPASLVLTMRFNSCTQTNKQNQFCFLSLSGFSLSFFVSAFVVLNSFSTHGTVAALLLLLL